MAPDLQSIIEIGLDIINNYGSANTRIIAVSTLKIAILARGKAMIDAHAKPQLSPDFLRLEMARKPSAVPTRINQLSVIISGE